MRPLRFARYWIAIGWLLVAGLVVVSLAPVPDEVAVLAPMDKLAHVVEYMLVMAWFAQIWSSPRTLLAHASFLVVLGVILELLQGAGGHRTADPLDALANLGGTLLGWLGSRTPAAGLLRQVEAWLPRAPRDT